MCIRNADLKPEVSHCLLIMPVFLLLLEVLVKTPGHFVHCLEEQYVVKKQHVFKMLTCPLTSKWSTAGLGLTVQQLLATSYIGQAREFTKVAVNRDYSKKHRKLQSISCFVN